MSRAPRQVQRVDYYNDETYPGHAELVQLSKRSRAGSELAGVTSLRVPQSTRFRRAQKPIGTGEHIEPAPASSVPDSEHHDTTADREDEEASLGDDLLATQRREPPQPSLEVVSTELGAARPCVHWCTHQRRCPVPRPRLPLRHPKETSSTPALRAHGYLFKRWVRRCKATYKNRKDLANHLMGLCGTGHGFYSPLNLFVVSSVDITSRSKTWSGKFEYDETER